MVYILILAISENKLFSHKFFYWSIVDFSTCAFASLRSLAKQLNELCNIDLQPREQEDVKEDKKVHYLAAFRWLKESQIFH